jgi:hypothetical protein
MSGLTGAVVGGGHARRAPRDGAALDQDGDVVGVEVAERAGEDGSALGGGALREAVRGAVPCPVASTATGDLVRVSLATGLVVTGDEGEVCV